MVEKDLIYDMFKKDYEIKCTHGFKKTHNFLLISRALKKLKKSLPPKIYTLKSSTHINQSVKLHIPFTFLLIQSAPKFGAGHLSNVKFKI